MTDIAISNLAWKESEDQQIFKIMHDLGIYNLEVSPFRDASMSEVDKQFDDRMSKLLDYYGIRVVALQSLMFRYLEVSLFKDEVTRNEIFKHLVDVLRFSNKVGSTVVIFGSPKNKIRGKMPYKETLDIAKNFFEKLADQAKRFNITFCIEPTPSVYGADFIQNTNEAINLIEVINHKSLKINLDIGSSILNKEKVEKIISKNIKHIGHIHISEPYLLTINHSHSFHKNIVQALKNNNYKGIVSIEMLPIDRANVKNISETLFFVKNIYQEEK